jgi:hypothetical protein
MQVEETAKETIIVVHGTWAASTIENDETLVHAAYYTDDECIARIADWISGRA